MSSIIFQGDSDIESAILKGGRSREQATDFLLKEHLGFIHSLGAKLHLEEDEVLDCYIDALADVVEQIGNGDFRRESKISTYFYQIAYFRCVDRCRKIGRAVSYEEEFPHLEDLSQRIGRRIEIENEVTVLKEYLEAMGEPCQGILLDWAWWGYSMKEIAKRNGLISPAVAKSRKYQCLSQLRKLMGINTN